MDAKPVLIFSTKYGNDPRMKADGMKSLENQFNMK